MNCAGSGRRDRTAELAKGRSAESERREEERTAELPSARPYTGATSGGGSAAAEQRSFVVGKGKAAEP